MQEQSEQPQPQSQLQHQDRTCVVCCSDMGVPAYQPDVADDSSDGSDDDNDVNGTEAAADKSDHAHRVQMSGRKATYTLSCGHTFHASCIIKHLRHNSLCPTCRFDTVARVPSSASSASPPRNDVSAVSMMSMGIGTMMGALMVQASRSSADPTRPAWLGAEWQSVSAARDPYAATFITSTPGTVQVTQSRRGMGSIVTLSPTPNLVVAPLSAPVTAPLPAIPTHPVVDAIVDTSTVPETLQLRSRSIRDLFDIPVPLQLVYAPSTRFTAKRRVQIYVPHDIAGVLASISPSAIFWEAAVEGAGGRALPLPSRHGIAAYIHFVYGDPYNPLCTWWYDAAGSWRHIVPSDIAPRQDYRVVLSRGTDEQTLRVCALSAIDMGDEMIASLASFVCAQPAPVVALAPPSCAPVSISVSDAVLPVEDAVLPVASLSSPLLLLPLLPSSSPPIPVSDADAETVPSALPPFPPLPSLPLSNPVDLLNVFPEEHPSVRIARPHSSEGATIDTLVRYIHEDVDPWALSFRGINEDRILLLRNDDTLRVAIEGETAARSEFEGTWEPAKDRLLQFLAPIPLL